MTEKIKPGYTRVTDMLKWIIDLSKLPPEILDRFDRKGVIGTNVHKAIEMNEKGEWYPLMPEEQPYFDSYLKWRKSAMPTFTTQEHRMYCDNLMISGQCDGVVRLYGDKDLCLIDYKTSAMQDDKIWGMQATFYHYLIKMEMQNISDEVIFLQLNPKGKLPKVIRYKADAELMKDCLAVHRIYKKMIPVDKKKTISS